MTRIINKDENKMRSPENEEENHIKSNFPFFEIEVYFYLN